MVSGSDGSKREVEALPRGRGEFLFYNFLGEALKNLVCPVVKKVMPLSKVWVSIQTVLDTQIKIIETVCE